jgi:hypothetical protein
MLFAAAEASDFLSHTTERETITSHTKLQKARDFQRDLPPVACWLGKK